MKFKQVLKILKTAGALLVAGAILGGTFSVQAASLRDVFDAKSYADDYEDLREAFGYDEEALFNHYLTYGIKEGREVEGLIDVVKYREAYPDLDAAFGDNWDAYVEHYLTCGIYENRDNFTDFNVRDYLERYADLKEAFGDDLMAAYRHYEAFGKAENREARSEAVVQEEIRKAEEAKREEARRDEEEGKGEEAGVAAIRIDPKTGEKFDLGGMEIIVADWFTGEKAEEDMSEFEKAQKEYRDWLQETYNFKMVQKNYAGWGWGEGSIGEAFVNAATQGSDENIIYVLTNSAATASYVARGLMYDVSNLDGDVVNLSDWKWSVNGELENWSVNGGKYCFYAGASEPRGVLYFNKDVLRDAGIDPESIYDMQKDGTWTWDAWVDIMSKVQRDTDNDGQIDIYGCVQDNGGMIDQCVRSNGGALVTKDENGKFLLTADSDAVREGLHFGLDTVIANYFLDYLNETGDNWEDYKYRFMNGEAAFMYGDVYYTYAGGWLTGQQVDADGNPITVNGNELSQDVDYGFVMFPKGPKADDYVTDVSNNPICMPSSYSDDKARLLMFAYDVWTDDLPDPQWEGCTGVIDNVYRGAKDTRCVEETLEMMATRGVNDAYAIVPDFKPFRYQLYVGQDVDALLDSNLAAWQTAVDAANNGTAE